MGKLSPDNRTLFFNRVNRGVVWSSVISDLEVAEGIVPMDGRAISIKKNNETILEVQVEQWDHTTLGVGASVVIDATGFDPWWFLRLIEKSYPEVNSWKDSKKSKMMQNLDQNLAFRWNGPLMQTPMLSAARGPGYASLMVLGNLSDAILAAYIQPK